jgi:glycosyltransferase involved in cell wall biosynthesis
MNSLATSVDPVKSPSREPLKVLITHALFAPDFAGGGEYDVLRISQQLVKHGIRVRVLTTGDPRVTSYEGIETVRLPIHRYRLNFAVDRVTELARDVDLIQTFNYHACLSSQRAAERLKKPCVCIVLAAFGKVWREMRGPAVGGAIQLAERYLLSRPYSRLIYLSDYSQQLASEMGVETKRSTVLVPGMDLNEFRPSDSKENVVLFAGKFERRKGILEVLESARRLPHVRFWIAGWGPEEDRVRNCSLANVEYLGLLRGEELRDAFARAAIYLLPSRVEGLPVALRQSMASGCAVVCTLPFEFKGIRLMSTSAESITMALDELTRDPDHLRQLGQENRRLAEQYPWDRFTRDLLSIYREVVADQ